MPRYNYNPATAHATVAKKGRKAQSVVIVHMENKPTVIHRGNDKKILDYKSRIKKIQFFRSMTPLAVRKTTADGFSKNIDKRLYTHNAVRITTSMSITIKT